MPPMPYAAEVGPPMAYLADVLNGDGTRAHQGSGAMNWPTISPTPNTGRSSTRNLRCTAWPKRSSWSGNDT